jgi:hypothetical protein
VTKKKFRKSSKILLFEGGAHHIEPSKLLQRAVGENPYQVLDDKSSSATPNLAFILPNLTRVTPKSPHRPSKPLVQATGPNKTIKAELVDNWNDYYARAKTLVLQAERLGFKQARSEKEKQKLLLDSLIDIISFCSSDTEEDSMTPDSHGGFNANFNNQPLRRIVKGPTPPLPPTNYHPPTDEQGRQILDRLSCPGAPEQYGVP